MHRRSIAAWLLALMAPGAALAAPAPDALSAIDVCIGRLDIDADIGFERIALRCPELARELTGSAWAAWLPGGWQDDYNNLSARSLAALRMAVVRERALNPRRRAPQLALLHPILADLAAGNSEHRGWWSRLGRSLRALFAPESYTSRYGRLAGRLALSQTLMQAAAYALLTCTVIFAGYIVVSEWLAFARPRRPSPGAGGQTQPPEARSLSWRDVERAAPQDRARVLFELILARLTAVQRLPAAGALTVRELTRAVTLGDAADRGRLLQIAFAAERMRFGVPGPPSAEVEHALEQGRELLARLSDEFAQRGAA